MRFLTPDQLRELSKNKNVRRCSSKSISYTKEFKTAAVRLYNEEGMSAVEIFRLAGFNLEAMGKRAPNRIMHQWNEALKPKVRIDIRRKLNLSEEANAENNVKRLKARIAYLQAENDFLAKIRAGKRKSS